MKIGLNTFLKIVLTTTDGLKFQPVLLPRSTFPALVGASHVAPPVALMSFMETFDTETVPLASLKVACVPAVDVSSVMGFPGVPDKVNALTVCVVPVPSRTVAGCTVLVMF